MSDFDREHYDDLNGEDFDAIADESADVDNQETDIISDVEGTALPPDAPLYQLQLSYSHETFFATYAEGGLTSGTLVVVPTRYGKDLAALTGRMRNCPARSVAKITRIERLATRTDLERKRENKIKENEAFTICKQKIEYRKLDMKLVTAHYLLEDPKILFFFTSDNRVDFRELVKDLVTVFKIRIELRQIGIRDESRITGGLGICGRPFCCHAISDKLKPVSIKMAKEQNLSLNAMKISGACGRLLCCLAYEHGFYAEQRRILPYEGTKIMYDNTLWKVSEVNAVLGKITLNAEDGRQLQIPKSRCEKTDKHWIIKA